MAELTCPRCQGPVDRSDRYCRSCGRAHGGQAYTDEVNGAILEALPVGLVLVDPDGRVRFWNRTMEEYTSRRRRDVLGRSLEDALPFLAPYSLQAMRVLETGLPHRLDQVSHSGPDEDVPLTATFWFRPVVLPDESAAVLAVMEDITQKVLVNNQLIRSERLAAVGELAAGVAHNFNNILAAIGGDAQLLKLTCEEERLPAHVGEVAQQIYEETMRGGRIAHELLSFARGAEPRIQRLDIREVVQDVLRLVKNHPAARTLSLEVEISPSLPHVEADPDLLHQVFFNLVLNALQAMPSGGILTVSAFARGHEEDPRAGLVDVKFHDTGVGISPQHLRRIFDPFFSNRASGASGSGLGLPVSLAMVKSIGGDINVASVEGIGTTVTVSLPIVERRSAPRDARRRSLGRALLIDDDPNVRRTLGTLLGRRGYEITEAGDADEALFHCETASKSRHFDLVLMEPMLAKGDGIATLERVQILLPASPIVVLTGATDPEYLLSAIEKGARFGFSKPPDFKELLAVVDAISRRAGAGSENGD